MASENRTTEDDLALHPEISANLTLVKSTTSIVVKEDASAWLRVLSGFFIFIMAWGPASAFGAFQSYYATDLLRDYSSSSIAWIGSTSTMLLVITGVITGPLFDRGYLRQLCLLGCFMMVLSFMLLSLCTEYYQIFLCQGIIFGIGSGIAYVPSLAAVSVSFDKNRPIAIGITASGASVGGVLFPIMIRQLQPRIGFPWAARTMGFILLALSIASLSILLREKPSPRPKRKLLQPEALTEPPYALFCFAAFLQFLAYWIPMFFIPSYALYHLKTSKDLSFYLLAVTNAASAFGRILPALMSNRIGVMPVIGVSTLACAVLIFAWIGVRDLAGFVVFCLLWGFFSGVFIAADPAALAARPLTPSLSVAGTRLGMCWLFVGVGVLIGTPAAGALVDLETASFVRAQVFAGVMMSVSALALIWPWISAERARKRGEKS